MARSRRGRLTKRSAVATILVGTVFAAGIAFAAWTASGTGSGYAKATSAEDLTTVDVSATTSATLYPGADGDVQLEIDNPNPYPVRVTGVALNTLGSITVDGAHAACNVASLTFTDQTGLTLDIGAGTSAPFTLTGAIHMGGGANDSCQGATFTIPVSLSGASNVVP
jgi:hypothetical protein